MWGSLRVLGLFTVLFFAIASSNLVPSIAKASIEIMPHGGLHWGPTFLTFKGVASDIPPVENAQRFSNLKADWANGDNDVAWNFGVDVIYRVPLSSINSERWGVGFRYQYSPSLSKEDMMFLLEQESLEDSGETSGVISSSEITTQRVAFLANYRFVTENHFFIGGLVLLDLWRFTKLKMECEDSVSVADCEDKQENTDTTSHKWIFKDSLVVQLGLEAGFQFNPHFIIKVELGYNVHWEAPYALLGMGFSFSSLSFKGREAVPNETLTSARIF